MQAQLLRSLTLSLKRYFDLDLWRDFYRRFIALKLFIVGFFESRFHTNMKKESVFGTCFRDAQEQPSSYLPRVLAEHKTQTFEQLLFDDVRLTKPIEGSNSIFRCWERTIMELSHYYFLQEYCSIVYCHLSYCMRVLLHPYI